MPATSLQQLKIPRGYRGDWPLQEYALIDAVEATINEIEVARGSNTSLAAELEETYATKTYVQLAIADPNVNDIYVSDLAVKLSESGLVGYTLQVRPGRTLAFTNTYTLGNGTLSEPAIKFNTSVSGGLFMTQNSSHETMNVKVSGGVALEIVHDKVSGANRLELGNFVAHSDGDIEATDITARAITSTGTGAYATHLAEAIIGEATINTLNVSTAVATITATDISFSYFGTILVLDAQNLNTLPEKSHYARTTNTCTNTPEVSAGYLNHYWSGAGQSRQTWVSSTTGYLYERVNNGAWTKYAKVGGDSSKTFEVATATSDTHAVTKLALDNAIVALGQDITDEAGDRAAADLLLQGAIDQEILDRGGAISTIEGVLSDAAVAQPITQVISSGSLNSQLTPGVYSFTNAVTGKPQPSGRGILMVFKDTDANEVVQLAVMLSLGLYGIATRHTTDGGIGTLSWSNWRIPADRDGDVTRTFTVADGVANTDAASYGQLISATSGLGTTKAQARYTNTASNTVTFAANTNIGTVTRTASGWAVTFATALPSANYIVVGTVTGAFSYGGRSFEPSAFTPFGFAILSQYGGDNVAGYNTHDGVIVNFVVY